MNILHETLNIEKPAAVGVASRRFADKPTYNSADIGRR